MFDFDIQTVLLMILGNAIYKLTVPILFVVGAVIAVKRFPSHSTSLLLAGSILGLLTGLFQAASFFILRVVPTQIFGTLSIWNGVLNTIAGLVFSSALILFLRRLK